MITAGELVDLLTEYDRDTPVHLATQPSWPMEYTLARAVTESDGVVYLAEDHQVGYLPGAVTTALAGSDAAAWT